MVGFKDAIKEGVKEGVKGAVKDAVQKGIRSAILTALKAKFGEDAVPEQIIAQQLEKITSKDKLNFLKGAVKDASSPEAFLKIVKDMAT